jgi:single-strand DNA-binding protein
MNIVVLSGRLLSDPTARELPSGEVIWSLDLSTEVRAAESATCVAVPVVWSGAELPGWAKGAELAVAGVVRRRFFRAGGSTQSRTEVVATKVSEITRRRSPERALAGALGTLDDAERATLRSALG